MFKAQVVSDIECPSLGVQVWANSALGFTKYDKLTLLAWSIRFGPSNLFNFGRPPVPVRLGPSNLFKL